MCVIQYLYLNYFILKLNDQLSLARDSPGDKDDLVATGFFDAFAK